MSDRRPSSRRGETHRRSGWTQPREAATPRSDDGLRVGFKRRRGTDNRSRSPDQRKRNRDEQVERESKRRVNQKSSPKGRSLPSKTEVPVPAPPVSLSLPEQIGAKNPDTTPSTLKKVDTLQITRGRNFMGVVMGTLQKFKQESQKAAEQENKKKEIEEKIQASIDADKKKAKDEENRSREEHVEKKRKLREERVKMQEQSRKRYLKKIDKTVFEQKKKYFETKVSPPVLWLPKIHSEKSLSLMEERKTCQWKDPFPEVVTDSFPSSSWKRSSFNASPGEVSMEEKEADYIDKEDNRGLSEDENDGSPFRSPDRSRSPSRSRSCSPSRSRSRSPRTEKERDRKSPQKKPAPESSPSSNHNPSIPSNEHESTEHRDNDGGGGNRDMSKDKDRNRDGDQDGDGVELDVNAAHTD